MSAAAPHAPMPLRTPVRLLHLGLAATAFVFAMASDWAVVEDQLHGSRDVVVFAAFALSVPVVARHWRTCRHLFASAPIIWFLLFLTSAALGVPQALVPSQAAAYVAGFAGLLAFAVALVGTFGLPLVLRLLRAAVSVGVVASVLGYAAHVAPGYCASARMHWAIPRFCGLYGQPNPMAASSALFIVLWLLDDGERPAARLIRWALPFVGALAGWAIWRANSRSAMLSLALALASVGALTLAGRLRTAPRRWRRAAYAGLALAAVAATGAGLLVASLGPGAVSQHDLANVSRGGSANEVMTLTGRTVVWEALWERTQERPLVGFGLGSTPLLLSRAWAPVDRAHNAAIEALVSTGWPGGIAYVLFVLALLWQGSRAVLHETPGARPLAGLIVFYFVLSQLEPVVIGSPRLSLLVMLVAGVALARTRVVAATRPAPVRLGMRPIGATPSGTGARSAGFAYAAR